MKKRITVVVLLVVLLTTSVFAFAGCQKTDYVIGIMEYSEHFSSDMVQKGFRDTLESMMTSLGKSYKLVYRKSSGTKTEDIVKSEKSNVDALLKKGVDIILTMSQSSADSVLENAPDTRMVFAQPAIADVTLKKEDLRIQVEKQVDLMTLIAPNAKLGILYCDPTIGTDGKKIEGYVKTKADINMEMQIEIAKEYMETLGIECVEKGYAKDETKTHDGHIREELNAMKKDGVGCVFMPVDNTVASYSIGPKVHERANTNIYTEASGLQAREVAKMPIVCGDINMNGYCGVATYAVDYYAMGVAAAQKVYELLNAKATSGEDVKTYAEIKTDFSKGNYVVNEKVAKDIGFTIPQSVKDLVNISK